MYGTLNCGTSSELRDRGLRAEPPYGTSLLAGPYGTLPHRTEAVRGDEPHYRTLRAYGTSLLTGLPITGLASLIRYSPLMDGGAYGTCFLTDFQLQDPSQGRTIKGAHGAPGRRRLRDELPFYGTLIYGPRDELPCGSLSYGTEAYGRRQRELTGRRGEGAFTGRAPFYGALNYGTSFSLLYTYSPLRDGGAYRTSFLTDLQDPSQGRTTRGLTGRRDEVAR